MRWLLILFSFLLATNGHAQMQSNPKLDIDGDPLPEGTLYRMGSKRFRMTNYLYDLKLSPDEQELIGICNEFYQRWDLKTGKYQKTDFSHFYKKNAYISAASIDPTCERLAAAVFQSDGDYTLRIWNLKTKKQISSVPIKNQINSIVWLPDHKHIVTTENYREFILRDANGKQIQPIISNPSRKSYQGGISLDGSTLAIWEEQKPIRIIDTISGDLLCETEFDGEWNSHPVYSPDRKLFACKTNNKLHIGNLTTGKTISTADIGFDYYGVFHFLSEEKGIYIQGSSWRQIDLTKGRVEKTYKLNQSSFDHTFLTNNRQKLICKIGTHIGIYDVNNPQFPDSSFWDGENSYVVLAENNTIFATRSGRNGIWRLWDINNGSYLRSMENSDTSKKQYWSQATAAFTDNDEFICCEFGHEVNRLIKWNVTNGKRISTEELDSPKENSQRYCSFDKKGNNLVSIYTNHSQYPPFYQTEVLDLWDKRIIRKNEFHFSESRWAISLGFNWIGFPTHDNSYPLVNTEPVVAIRSVQMLSFDHPDRVLDIPISKQVGHVFSTSNRSQLVLLGSQNMLWQKQPGGGASGHCAGDCETLLWDLQSNQLIFKWTITAFKDTQANVTLSPNGSFLVYRDGTYLCLYDPFLLHKVVARLNAGEVITSIHFSPNGNRLLTHLQDGTMLAWDVTYLQKLLNQALAKAKPPQPEPTLKDLLADSQTAYSAARWLSLQGNATVELLRKQIRPTQRFDAEMQRLLGEIDSPRFAVREKATSRLIQIGPSIQPTIQALLKLNLSAEKRHRLENIQQTIGSQFYSAEVLQQLRAVQILEWINTKEARQLLQEWSQGDPDALLTKESLAVLEQYQESAK